MANRCSSLEALFPKLAAAGYNETSEQTGRPPTEGAYNCIAWAASVSDQWWWPEGDDYWPWWSERKTERKNFIRAFNGLGYFVCEDSRLEPNFEKVALYEKDPSIPEHMARQMPDRLLDEQMRRIRGYNAFHSRCARSVWAIRLRQRCSLYEAASHCRASGSFSPTKVL